MTETKKNKGHRGRLYDKLLIVDIEATCWEKQNEVPQGEKMEIIEVGLCLMDMQTLELSDKTSILCKPQISTVSKYCTDLTTLTQEQLDAEGIPFQEACQILREKFKSKKRRWASFGHYDETQFNRNAKDFGIKTPFDNRHTDIKGMATLLLGLKKEPGAKKLCKILNIDMEGVHHRGHDDAWNIGKCLAKLIRIRRLVSRENVNIYEELARFRKTFERIKELTRPDKKVYELASNAIQMDAAEKSRVLAADEAEYERDG